MERFSHWEVGFISSSIFILIGRIRKGTVLHDKNYNAFEEGAKFLSQMMSSSFIVESMMDPLIVKGEKPTPSIAGYSPTEGFNLLKKSQEVLKRLELQPEDAIYSVVFESYRSDLEKLTQRQSLDEEKFIALQNFFLTLHEVVWEERAFSRHGGGCWGLNFHGLAA